MHNAHALLRLTETSNMSMHKQLCDSITRLRHGFIVEIAGRRSFVMADLLARGARSPTSGRCDTEASLLGVSRCATAVLFVLCCQQILTVFGVQGWMDVLAMLLEDVPFPMIQREHLFGVRPSMLKRNLEQTRRLWDSAVRVAELGLPSDRVEKPALVNFADFNVRGPLVCRAHAKHSTDWLSTVAAAR